VNPVDALERIGYLLERQHAETFKVRAFRRAAEALAGRDPAELETLVRSGGLERLPGVGATTASVIRAALSGAVPGYLATLEARPLPEPSEAAQRYLRILRGDCHSHSDWSDGGSPIEAMAYAARALGHDYLVLTDHSPRLTVAHGLSRERLLDQVKEVSVLNERLAPFRVLTGIEVDILGDGTLDQDEDLLASLDVVVASVHSKLGMDAATMTPRMVRAVENPHTDILGHCTGRILAGRGRKPSQFDASAVFDACARTGTAVEINSRPERRDPPAELLREAVRRGCLVSIDTDAHAPGQLEWLGLGCEQAAAVQVPEDRIVNARDAGALLTWTRR
jgi:putative hydrolase